jgi:ATP-dependent RNA helicase DeaD
MPFPNLPPVLGEALAARGYALPTPVQAAVLEPEAAGRDLVVSAQTGSGKTVAFGMAMAPDLLRADGMAETGTGPLALVIAPTRELALQVSRELVWLYGKAGLRVATCVGGWIRRRSGARCARAHRWSSARRGGCATISSAGR